MAVSKILLTALAIVFLTTGCATFRSEMQGASGLEAERISGVDPVDVLFISRHLEQTKGLDAIPKLQNHYQIIPGYDDMLLDASHEFSNLNRYAAYTEFSSDMSDPKRIALKDSLIANYAYRIVIELRQEKSFSKYFLGTIGSVLSLTLIPIPYEQDFFINVSVLDGAGRFMKGYTRSATTKKWVEAFLLPVYPFHTEKRKTEEIYVAFLHDVFREIDKDQILQP